MARSISGNTSLVHDLRENSLLDKRFDCGLVWPNLQQCFRAPMIDPKILNDISSKVGDTLPKGLQALQNDLQHNLHSGMESMLGKLNLITREEFDIQQAVLMRTRAKVEALEKQVFALEKMLENK